jgi:hypothetical protein
VRAHTRNQTNGGSLPGLSLLSRQDWKYRNLLERRRLVVAVAVCWSSAGGGPCWAIHNEHGSLSQRERGRSPSAVPQGPASLIVPREGTAEADASLPIADLFQKLCHKPCHKTPSARLHGRKAFLGIFACRERPFEKLPHRFLRVGFAETTRSAIRYVANHRSALLAGSGEDNATEVLMMSLANAVH